MNDRASKNSRRGAQDLSRRGFIAKTAAAATATAMMPLLSGRAWAAGGVAGVSVVLDANDPLSREAPARWAAGYLCDALTARGLPAHVCENLEQAPAGQECIVATGRTSALARAGGLAVPDAPEALGLTRCSIGDRKVVLAGGSDTRGLVYALLELVDRVNLGEDPLAALRGVETVVERPANRIRGAMRLFVSETEDKEWYNDRAFWRDYLTMLATHRFNRFNLALGLGYDGPAGLTDAYFYYTYPFLVTVPGHDVRAARLPAGEARANLEMLQFISSEAALRGIHFQLGLWTHAYKWADGPRVNYMIEGLTDDTQAAYSRDALRTLLEACPAIKGVTFRIHGESGVPEGSYDFWRTVFDGVVKSGRPLELDLHAKGMDQETLDVALATGLPVSVSPKFWAEHMGLPYMQAAIRNLEMPRRDSDDTGFFSRSTGSRSFLRYSYGDLLQEGRKYSVLHRVWPGTQRVLLWGDPTMASALGRNWNFCGSDGMEFMEPLSFKGRKGSGLPGRRDGYADAAFSTGGSGWEKYLYTYRLWGRLSYNPDANPDNWMRLLRHQFGAGAQPAREALANASRILPLVTSIHAPSAANNNYWPEMYLNMPIVNETRRGLYSDSPTPRRFDTVSPLDPQLFLTVDEFADELMNGKRSGKYSPGETAQWLETLARRSSGHLAAAERTARPPKSPEFRRLSVDTAAQTGLGLFFAWKLRAGALYELYVRSGHRRALERAVAAYESARTAWAQFAERAKGVYVADVTYGFTDESRGHWLDRLAAIDSDIASMRKKRDEPAAVTAGDSKSIDRAMAEILSPPPRSKDIVDHAPPGSFKRGETIAIELSARGRAISTQLHYRRVNQAETWRSVEMAEKAGRWSAAIPAEYTDSEYCLQYYFELRGGTGRPRLHPGLGTSLMNRPYFVVRQDGKAA
jgi:hypothetical protein